MALFYVFNIKAILQKVPGPFRVCLYGAIWRPVPATSILQRPQSGAPAPPGWTLESRH